MAKLVARLTKYKMADIGKGVANTLQPAKKYIKKYWYITLNYNEANKIVNFFKCEKLFENLETHQHTRKN